MKPIPITDLSWLAGYLEGEGYFAHRLVHGGRTSTKRYLSCFVAASSIDHENVLRCQSIAGGRINGPYRYKTRHRPAWRWQLSSREEVAGLVAQLRPLMSPRRQEAIDGILDALPARPMAGKPGEAVVS